MIRPALDLVEHVMQSNKIAILNPVKVHRVEIAGCLPIMNCHNNSNHIYEKTGFKPVRGMFVHEHHGVLIVSSHSVNRTPSGKLLDYTQACHQHGYQAFIECEVQDTYVIKFLDYVEVLDESNLKAVELAAEYKEQVKNAH
ncbi:hypothetical protein L4C31_02920 [Aliivibrio sifiae]